jgi:hypothetical protein
VIGAILRWNASYGPSFGSVVVPVSWRENAAARYGSHPQATLNEQLVDRADVVIALFWSRIGTPTPTAASGTVEEIERSHAAGAYVGVLRCMRPLPSDVDTDQLGGLRAYLRDASSRSLNLEYSDTDTLGRHVEAILNQSLSRFQAKAESSVEQAAVAEVWPRIERDQHFSRGRTETRYRLVLVNTGSEPARDVRHQLEAEETGGVPPLELGEASSLESLAPTGDASYTLVLTAATTGQCRCRVTWTDSRGQHERVATLRLF